MTREAEYLAMDAAGSATGSHASEDGTASPGPALPEPVARASTAALVAFAGGAVLMGVSFLTNPVPDPSFPWATLPASLRLGYAQPRIEHWPVTYTVGLWLIVFATPLVLLAAYRRLGSRLPLRASTWFAAVPALLMLGVTTYCRFFWPKLQPPTWNAPSYTLVCWGYCSTYDPLWSNLAYAVALLGLAAAGLAYRGSAHANRALAAFGLLAFPLGVPALVGAYVRQGPAASHRKTTRQ